MPLFHQPVTMPDFFDKIRDQKVRIYLMDLSIFGLVGNYWNCEWYEMVVFLTPFCVDNAKV